MQVALGVGKRTFYLPIDRYTLGIKCTLSEKKDVYLVTLYRKTAGITFGNALDAMPSDYKQCYGMVSTQVGETAFGVTAGDVLAHYEAVLVYGNLELRELSSAKLVEFLKGN